MRLALALALFAALPAAAQYRAEQRPVMEPQPAPAAEDRSKEIRESFQSAYRAAGAPRMALFWNVLLTDQVAEGTTTSSRVRGETNQTVNRLEQETAGEAGTSRLVDGDSRRTTDVTINRSSRATDSSRRGMPLAERDAWLLETAFTKTLMEGGANLIDRSIIIRLAALDLDPGKGRDQRTAESKALLGKADVLLEILMTRDTESPLGWGFRCTLREINTGRLKGSFYSRAIPVVAKPPARFAATTTGFQRVDVRPVLDVHDVGRKLALDTMNELQTMLGK